MSVTSPPRSRVHSSPVVPIRPVSPGHQVRSTTPAQRASDVSKLNVDDVGLRGTSLLLPDGTVKALAEKPALAVLHHMQPNHAPLYDPDTDSWPSPANADGPVTLFPNRQDALHDPSGSLVHPQVLPRTLGPGLVHQPSDTAQHPLPTQPVTSTAVDGYPPDATAQTPPTAYGEELIQ